MFTPVEERDGRLVGLLPVDRRRRARDRVPARAVPRHHGRRGRGRRAPALGAARLARRQHRHQPARRGHHALPAGAGAPGALAYVGDPHFAQGDGEVALTALEASLRATLRFDVVPRAEALAEFGEVDRAARADAGVPGARPGSTPTSTRRCATACARRSRSSQARWGMRRAPRLRVPQRRDRLRHLAGRRHRVRRARAHPRGRLRAVDRATHDGRAAA